MGIIWMWQKEPTNTGWYAHQDELAWFAVHLPHNRISAVFYRMGHSCRAQSIGIHGHEVTARCACGAVQFGTTDIHTHAWTPHSPKPFTWTVETPWQERNSRYLGTAMFYRPMLTPLQEPS